MVSSIPMGPTRWTNLDASRGLCRQIRSARGKNSDLVVTVLPESLIDENLLKVAGGAKKRKPATFGGTRLKKCHWQGTSKWFLDGFLSNPNTPTVLVVAGDIFHGFDCVLGCSSASRPWVARN